MPEASLTSHDPPLSFVHIQIVDRTAARFRGRWHRKDHDEMEGRLFFVVGPSGSGKDTLLNGAKGALAADGRVVFAPRVITRPAGVGNEDHLPCGPEEFDRRIAAGAFLIHWSAHGLKYGIPIHLVDHLAAGRNVVVNGSRAAVAELLGKTGNVTVVEIS